MKKVILVSLAVISISACAHFSRHFDSVERDEFLNKLPMVNNEILGELKYDDPEVDLRTLGLDSYPEMYKKIDLTEDYREVLNFINDNISEQQLFIKADTFIICLRSPKYEFVLCDDASTTDTAPDKIREEMPIPTIEDVNLDLSTD